MPENKIPEKPFEMPHELAMRLVQLHQDLSDLTEKSNPKTIPPDIVEVEFSIAKCEVVRKHLLGDENGIDEKRAAWNKAVPRHGIQVATPYQKRLFGLLHSAEEIDALPVSQHTKIDILGAQVRFVKYLRRLRFVSAYRLYKVVISPWFR